MRFKDLHYEDCYNITHNDDNTLILFACINFKQNCEYFKVCRFKNDILEKFIISIYEPKYLYRYKNSKLTQEEKEWLVNTINNGAWEDIFKHTKELYNDYFDDIDLYSMKRDITFPVFPPNYLEL